MLKVIEIIRLFILRAFAKLFMKASSLKEIKLPGKLNL